MEITQAQRHELYTRGLSEDNLEQLVGEALAAFVTAMQLTVPGYTRVARYNEAAWVDFALWLVRTGTGVGHYMFAQFVDHAPHPTSAVSEEARAAYTRLVNTQQQVSLGTRKKQVLSALVRYRGLRRADSSRTELEILEDPLHNFLPEFKWYVYRLLAQPIPAQLAECAQARLADEGRRKAYEEVFAELGVPSL